MDEKRRVRVVSMRDTKYSRGMGVWFDVARIYLDTAEDLSGICHRIGVRMRLSKISKRLGYRVPGYRIVVPRSVFLNFRNSAAKQESRVFLLGPVTFYLSPERKYNSPAFFTYDIYFVPPEIRKRLLIKPGLMSRMWR